jgi:ATP-binding cassette subfamily B protein
MMYEVLDARPTLIDQPNASDLSAARAEIRFDNVTFGYGGQPVVAGLNLTAPAGAIVALVGPSGAGKSTLLSLIERFYDPDGGVITINGTPLRDFTLESLRRNIALVTQDTFLFDGTIAENIADGRHAASMDEIIAAARDANAYGFIMDHPDGFNARVGGGGSNLSGGQRQRIAIARAILRQAPILLLDEATSALDSQAEAEIQEALVRLMHGRTTIVIAHRLATVREADIIYVLDKGVVRQSGTHAALLAEGGLYADLYALQFRPERADRTALAGAEVGGL